jgi:hypothetical protein
MTIPEIKAVAEREGSLQIIVSFLDEDTMTVAVKIQRDGFGGPTYGDFAKLSKEEHTEEKIRQCVDFIVKQLADALKEV